MAGQSVQRGLMFGVRMAVVRTLYSALGHGIAGHVGSSLAYGAMATAGRPSSSKVSDSDRKKAIVAAFVSVQDQFRWDAARKQWVAAKAAAKSLTPFARQLQDHPVTDPYDRSVLARMLVEIAAADQEVTDEERAFLAPFVPPELGTVEELAERPPLSRIELEEAGDAPVRHTMLMCAWAVALTDEELDPREQARLTAHADGLGLSVARADEIADWARGFVVEQTLRQAHASGRGNTAREEALIVADRIGLGAEEAERIDIRVRKQLGAF